MKLVKNESHSRMMYSLNKMKYSQEVFNTLPYNLYAKLQLNPFLYRLNGDVGEQLQQDLKQI